MKPNLWPSREPIIKEFAGKVKAENIAKMLDMNTNTLKYHCSKNGISLRCVEEQKKALEKVRALRQTARMEAADSPVRLRVDIEKLWKIPKRCFHQAHMGNFT